ncbi:MAG TPA: acetolactate synthase small subunit [Clostridiaceae bacterium]|jgi:acetolactate synthase-1/3 small subunit|nr:acetolactate synthase small subunit [Clostridiaceae bacterium]
MNRYVLSLLVENQAGVLSKIAGLFTRRGYNIDSLTVGITDNPDISRVTIMITGDEQMLEQISKQLNKLIDVIKVTELSSKSVIRELALIKLSYNMKNQSLIKEAVNIFRGNIVDIDSKSMMIEVTGTEDKVTAFIDLVKPYGIKELVRSGVTGLERS